MRLQTGYVYHYAFAMLIGVAALVTWYHARRSALMIDFGILSGLIFLPLVGAAFILLAARRGRGRRTRNARWIGAGDDVVTFVLSLVAWAGFDTGNAGFQFVEKHVPGSADGIRYQAGRRRHSRCRSSC